MMPEASRLLIFTLAVMCRPRQVDCHGQGACNTQTPQELVDGASKEQHDVVEECRLAGETNELEENGDADNDRGEHYSIDEETTALPTTKRKLDTEDSTHSSDSETTNESATATNYDDTTESISTTNEDEIITEIEITEENVTTEEAFTKYSANQQRRCHLNKLLEKQSLLEQEIQSMKLDMSLEELIEFEEIKTSVVNKRLTERNYSRHVMVIPVAEAVEKQLMIILKDREKILEDFLNVLQNNINMMKSTADLVGDLVEFGTEQISVIFGEKSPLYRIFTEGFAPFIANVDDIVGALTSLVDFKRHALETFLSEDYNRSILLKNIEELAVHNIIPAKVEFLINLFNNSDSIRSDIDSMMYHISNLINLKQSVIDSVLAYVEQNRKLIEKTIGKEFRFDTFFRELESGQIFRNISIGPFESRGLLFDRMETRYIIKNYISAANPKLPLIETPIKEIMVDMEEVEKTGIHIDAWLATRFTDIVMDSVYWGSVKNGDILLSTSSPPVLLGSRCGIGFRMDSSQLSLRLRRTSRVSVTKGITYGTRRSPSLDIIGSAWLDSDVSLAGRGTVTMSRRLLSKCFKKMRQKADLWLSARARTYISAKISITDISIRRRPVDSDIFVPEHVVGRVLPHIVLRFSLRLSSSLTSVSMDALRLTGCRVAIWGFSMLSYCNLLQRLLLTQVRSAMEQSLPLSSQRAMRRIESALYRRFGNEIYVPLYIDDEKPVESFLLTVDNVVKVGQRLAEDITHLVHQMHTVKHSLV